MGLCACRGRVAAPAPAGCFEQGGRTASSCLPNPWLLQHIQKNIRTRAPLSHPRAHRLRPSRLLVAGPANLHVALRQGLHTAPWRGCSFRRLHVTRTAEGRKRECGQCRRLRARSAAGGCACCCRSAVSPSYRCVPMGCAAAGSGEGVPFLLFCVSARAIFARRVALPSPASRRRRASVPCCYPGGAARPRSARRTLRKRCPPKFSLSLTGC